MAQENITTIVDELLNGFARLLPKNSPEEQRFGIGLLRALARRGPLKADDVAQALDISPVEAKTFLEQSELGRLVLRDKEDRDRILGFWGLATFPTHHQLAINGRTLWANCAGDSLFLPVLLGETARIESKDPENGEVIKLTVSPSGVESVTHENVFVSVNAPEMWDLSSAEKAIGSVCHYIYYFASRASGQRWVAKHPGTVLLPLDAAFDLVYRMNSDERVFGKELARREDESELLQLG